MKKKQNNNKKKIEKNIRGMEKKYENTRKKPSQCFKRKKLQS